MRDDRLVVGGDPMQHDGLDRMLAASAPPTTPLTGAIEDELARMAVAARTDRASSRPDGASGRPGARRAAAIALAAVTVLGGAGAAAAVGGGWASWWANEPDGVYTFTLPSGATCEGRVGNVMASTADASARQAVRDYLARIDIMDEIDVDAELAWIDRDDFLVPGPEGGLVPAPPDSEHQPSPDARFIRAVTSAIATVITKELERRGFDVDFGPDGRRLSYDSELRCPGAQW